MATRLTPARPTDTTVLTGLLVASSSVPAHGTDGAAAGVVVGATAAAGVMDAATATDAAAMAMAAVTMALGDMDVAESADTVAVADIVAESADIVEVADTEVAADSTVAAVASTAVAADMVVEADTAKRRVLSFERSRQGRLAANCCQPFFCSKNPSPSWFARRTLKPTSLGTCAEEGSPTNVVLRPGFLVRMCGRGDGCGSKIAL